MSSQTIETSSHQLAYNQTEGDGPGVVFLGGYYSNKEGNKALYLEDWAQRRGRAYLRFDYSGHGQSSGDFWDGSIGSWAEDSAAIISSLTDGPQILVGSSMGAWIALLLAREMPDKVAGLLTVSGAPDFTEDQLLPSLSDAQRAELEQEGRVRLASKYDGDPYIFTKHFIDDGRKRLVMRSPLHLRCPVRLLHGDADTDIDPATSLRLFAHAEAEDMRLTLVKGADHRFSDARCLALIIHTLEDLSGIAR